MAQNSKQVTLARSAVDRRCHVCAFFHSREDEYKVMLPFLKEGLEAGEKVFQIIDQRQRDERLRRLTDAGVDAAAAEQNGLLEVRSWENAHLSDGRFDQHAMIALVEGIAKDGEKRSGVTRLWANMEWALEDFPGVHDLLEYRVAHQLHAAEIRHGHCVHLRLGEVQRRHRHGRAAHASESDRRRHPAGEPVLRAAG